MIPRHTRQQLTDRFSPGSTLFFGTVVGWLTCWVVSYDSCDMEHAAPGSVLRASRSSNASFGLPGPPAGGRGKDSRIHNDSARHSTAAQREVASLCLYICCHHFCTSTFCAGVGVGVGKQSPERRFFCWLAVGSVVINPACSSVSLVLARPQMPFYFGRYALSRKWHENIDQLDVFQFPAACDLTQKARKTFFLRKF